MSLDLKIAFLKMYTEIEFNAIEDTLFQRMTLARLQQYSDEHFGTHLHQDTLDESAEANEYLGKGHTEKEWRERIRRKRVKQIDKILRERQSKEVC